MRSLFLWPGKTLTDPLFVTLVIAIVLAVLALRRARGDRPLRRILAGLLAILLALWFLSTAVAVSLLQKTLAVGPRAGAPAPEVIVVAASGTFLGARPELDVLTGPSQLRILAGVEWWKQHPHTRMILSGADTTSVGLSTRTLELMRDTAIRHGVPPPAITLETRSRNTREHPPRVLELPGMTRQTRLGLVTSGYHMRRALREFRRHFETVIPHPAVAGPPNDPFVFNDILPGAPYLSENTRMLHEWIGLAWYALRR